MAKTKPPGYNSLNVYLPEDLHNKIKSLVKFGKANDLIVECLAEAIAPRWKEWIERHHAELQPLAKSKKAQKS